MPTVKPTRPGQKREQTYTLRAGDWAGLQGLLLRLQRRLDAVLAEMANLERTKWDA